MKSLITLFEKLATDVASWSYASTHPSASEDRIAIEVQRDVDYVRRRFEHEGTSFLTITLPKFRSDLEIALDRGFVGDDLFVGFRPSNQTELPSFLGGLTRLVFERNGVLLHDPNPEAIKGLRQLSGVFGKILLPCSDARVEAALDAYMECENDVEANTAALLVGDPSVLDDVSRVSSLLYRDVLANVDTKVFYYSLVPRHGPGATADKLKGNQKWTLRTWHSRLEQVFPYRDYLLPSPRFERSGVINIVEPSEEAPVKVTLVPKTLKTPRVIAIEPSCMQYTQQALAQTLIDELAHSAISPLIGFDDQTPNQRMAQIGSLSGALATLDLSEASDRVSNLLVETVFANNPQTSEAVQAARSLKADVPGRGVLPLLKYASMGSALTFPIEAMTFLVIVFLGIEKSLGRRLSRSDITRLRGKVRIFGDDIIVPKEYALSVVETLESYGLKVNSSKSFWTGRFRESCGKEYFSGYDVSFVKLRRVLPTRLTDTEEVISLVAFRNLLYEQGYWTTCRWLDQKLDRILRGRYPVIGPTSPSLGRLSRMRRFDYNVDVWDDDTQAHFVRGWKVQSLIPDNEINDQAALLKCLVTAERSNPSSSREEISSPDFRVAVDILGSPSSDFDHLLKSGRPLSVKIKRALVPAG